MFTIELMNAGLVYIHDIYFEGLDLALDEALDGGLSPRVFIESLFSHNYMPL